MTESAKNKFNCDWVGLPFLSRCRNQLFFKHCNGKDYCVLHYPDTDKLESFRIALKNKLDEQDFDFEGVWFPETANFRGITFSAPANFIGARFYEAADFRNANFSAAADFQLARFNANADFSSASFRAAVNFAIASFGAVADFSSVGFSSDADFSNTGFGADANFGYSYFKDYVRFSGSVERKGLGEQARLDLQFARIEKPERVSFHTMTLRPHWFINVDSRKFDFIDVDWNFRLKKEELKGRYENLFGASAPHRLLAITYRQLADNSETNHRYHEASRFRFNAFEVRRIEKVRGFVPWRLDWWYWLASGYGESVGRAALVFIVLLALFTFGYKSKYSEFIPAISTATPSATVMTQGDQPAAPEPAPKRLGWREAALYSFNVSLLQKPEPKPKGLWSSFLVALQTVLGPAQAALLALAVRRRFMR